MRRSHALVALLALGAVVAAAGQKEKRRIPLVSAEDGEPGGVWRAGAALPRRS